MKLSSIALLGTTILLLGCAEPVDPTVNGSGYKVDVNPFDTSTEQYKGFKAAFHGEKCDSDSEEFNEGCEKFYESQQE